MPLSDDQLDRPFDIGHRTVRATLQHIIFNTEAWSALMAGATTLPPRPPREGESLSGLADRLTHAAPDLAQVAHAVRAREGWDDRWLDVLDDPTKAKTYGGAIAHLIMHGMHLRAQLLYLLRQLGLTQLPEGMCCRRSSSAGRPDPLVGHAGGGFSYHLRPCPGAGDAT